MAAQKSKRAHRARRARKPQPDFGVLHDALFQLNEAIALVATTWRSLQAVEDENGRPEAVDVCDQIASLGFGVTALRKAYERFGTAIMQVTP